MNILRMLFVGMMLCTSSEVIAENDTKNEQKAIAIVDKQLAAYNSQDINAFVATYHENVEIYDFPDKLKYTGRDQLRKNYQGMFANLKCLNATSQKRIVLNNTVIDHELAKMCTKQKGQVDREFKVIAIYEVEEGLIKRVMFQK